MKIATLIGAAALVLFACSDTKSVGEKAISETSTQSKQHSQYSAKTFYQTTSYGLANGNGFAYSPDNSKILAESDASGVYNVITITPDGSVAPITSSTTDEHFPESFFPNDERILFSADKGGNELTHIYVRELNGTITDLTPSDETRATFGGWRNDGAVFYIWTNERDSASFDLYAYNSHDYKRRMIYENEGFQPSVISPDGNWLALEKSLSSADANLYLVSLSSGSKQPRLITEHKGNINYFAYDFNADSSQLIFATNEFGEFNQAWTYDLTTGDKAELITADWDVSYVIRSPSGRYQVHALNIDGLTQVTVSDLKTGEAIALPGVPNGQLGQVRFSRDEKQIAFGVNTDTSPYNLYTMTFGKEAVRLTNALNPAIDEADLVSATVERFESFDGLIIPGIMYKPKRATAETPVPAIVLVHGGPGGQSTRGYDAQIQHLVNHGYAVYAANNRGSSGYGKTFFHLDDKRHGEGDLKDIVAAGDYLRSLDWVDSDKVAVMGGSYGGYITAAALTFHPHAFEAGINVFGVTNWVRTLESIPPWWGSFRDALYDEMGDPATDSERHRAISPLFHAENIVKPMLVVQGANDPRVLQIESDELVAAARKNGATVDYVIFDDEGHGFLKRENRIAASNAYLNFLDKHLKGKK
ncbi:S9 family peptidase [Glaciecola sp. MH2013]|uniref:S9 family peptidase n=1 Tax=Glaciecola sp. MH2013 TaxID=2785524 RepID=UPI0018A10B1F|nr:S9 family peptidase [Glaciecola sp. MH2013]MBF7073593.1 S9 family peptidase [Glaciecola sp. MH2013]